MFFLKSLLSASIAASSLVLSAPAIARPFGFDTASKQNPANVYSYCEDDGSGFFNITCTNAPKPHPDMRLYVISFVEGLGICAIKGGTNDISDNGRGTITQTKTDDIAKQVKNKYGAWTKKSDFLASGSIWDESHYWMMSILKKDRYYSYTWELSSPIDGIDEVYVAARALHSDTGYVVTEFYTPIVDKCEEAIEKSAASSF